MLIKTDIAKNDKNIVIVEIDKNMEELERKIKEIALLETKIFPETSYSYSELLEMLTKFEQYHFFCIEEKGSVVAYLLLLDSVDCFEILKIAVREQDRRQGLGEKLLKAIPRGDIFLEVRESNQRARNFYQKLGFQEIARRKEYYPDTKETAIIMKVNKDGGKA